MEEAIKSIANKKKILFIINPISGVYRKEGVPEKIRQYIDYIKYDYTIRNTEYAGHATEIAKQAVAEGYQVVVAVGGDGSINEVAQALVGTPVALGIIPYGSGNGMAGHLKIPIRNAQGAIEVLNTGKTIPIDVMTSNFRPFFSVAGFGFDAHAARRFRSQEIRGFFSYFLAGIREIFYHFKPVAAKVKIDDIVIEDEIYLFTMFNASEYGYKFGIFPNTSMRDGIMDVIVLRKFSLTRLLFIVFALMIKRPDLIKEAELFRAKKVTIFGKQKMVYQIDGDHFIYHEDLHFEVSPMALNIIVPGNLNAY